MPCLLACFLSLFVFPIKVLGVKFRSPYFQGKWFTNWAISRVRHMSVFLDEFRKLKHRFCCYHPSKLLRGTACRLHSWGSSTSPGCFRAICGCGTSEKQKLLSYSFESCKSHVSVPVALTSVKSGSWSTDSIFSPGVRNKYHPETSSLKTLILRTLFLWPNHPQRSHLQNLLPWSGNSNMIFWDTGIRSKEVMRWFHSCWSKSIQCLWKEVKGHVRMCGECLGGV